ncbi:DamX protein [Halopseudomonas xinjiangensis]|uniref:DamX protein n=1 Tax=Halopseudomonas xinjiangensis TaxID=487184 RepID=A0A1H1YYM8_9GAMM|nr:AAA family ATPase [Halopseudomonas xinjiangensis]SDT26528.1 DamX protein [Halopseudomonas xinjiangensis]
MKAERDPGINAVTDEQAVLEYYQLSHDPFAPRTPGFKFFTPQRKPVLAQLHHLARFGGQVLVVTGPRGSGKTLLRQALVASTNKDAAQCVVTSGREAESPAVLVATLCQAVGVSEKSVAALLERAEQMHDIGMQLYVVVDDAHLLDAESLQLLADLSQIDAKFAPKVFLFGEDVLAGTLVTADMADDQPWYHRISLQALSLEETREYLAQRLEGAGQSIELFSDAQVAWIHEESEGWPGRINEAAKRALQDDREDVAPVSARRTPIIPRRSLIALVLVSLGVIAAWMMGDNEPVEPSTTVLELPEPVPEVDMTSMAAPSSLPPSEPVDPMEAASDMPEDLALFEPPQDASAGSALADAPSSASPQTGTMQPSAAAEPEAAAAVAPEPVAVVEAPALQPQPPQQADPNPSAAPAATDASSWYRQQAGNRYVLQLLGSHSRQAALEFMSAHDLSDLHFFETRHEGKPWFVVTQGAYADRQQAQAAANQLPGPLRQLKPWPRTIASIQQSLP